MSLRHVAIFDAELPTGMAFIRSLGRRGVPSVVYGDARWPPGRFSRWSGPVRPGPSVFDNDGLTDWLVTKLSSGEVDLVAPTSDFVAHSLAEAHDRLGVAWPAHPTLTAIQDCLFKDRFARRSGELGFPSPPSAQPLSLEEAAATAEEFGYPVVIKPRSHLGIGWARGGVVRTPDELAQSFAPYELFGRHASLDAIDPGLRWPMLQKFFPHEQVDVVSVTGCLGPDGEVLALTHSRKLRSWPPGLGVGSRFEALGEQPFTPQAVDAVRGLLGTGLFELEVLVDRTSGERWAIDLNPRAWGQIALSAADGFDMPSVWYDAATGGSLDRVGGRRRPPRYWQAGVPFYSGAILTMVAGPHRSERARELAEALRSPRVGPMLDWRDPGPGVATAVSGLRHPARLVKNFLRYRRDDPALVRR